MGVEVLSVIRQRQFEIPELSPHMNTCDAHFLNNYGYFRLVYILGQFLRRLYFGQFPNRLYGGPLPRSTRQTFPPDSRRILRGSFVISVFENLVIIQTIWTEMFHRYRTKCSAWILNCRIDVANSNVIRTRSDRIATTTHSFAHVRDVVFGGFGFGLWHGGHFTFTN